MKSNYPLISVVVACWNVEKYIQNCLNSILTQTYANLEILVVDDCSTDSTLAILKTFEQKDERIHVISRHKNGGLSECRNSGILAATGELLAFVDGDDALAPNAYEEIVKNYDPSIDVYWFGTKIVYEANKDLKTSDDQYYRIKNDGLHQIGRNALLDYDCSACNKVFKRALVEKEYFFSSRFYEDALFFMKFFAFPRKIFFIKKELYIYYRRQSSIMANTFQKKEGVAIHHLYILDDLYDFWTKKGLLPENRIEFQKIVLSFFSFAYKFSPTFERARVLSEMISRLRKWNIGFESSPILDYLYNGKYFISFNPLQQDDNKLPSILPPPPQR